MGAGPASRVPWTSGLGGTSAAREMGPGGPRTPSSRELSTQVCPESDRARPHPRTRRSSRTEAMTCESALDVDRAVRPWATAPGDVGRSGSARVAYGRVVHGRGPHGRPAAPADRLRRVRRVRAVGHDRSAQHLRGAGQCRLPARWTRRRGVVRLLTTVTGYLVVLFTLLTLLALPVQRLALSGAITGVILGIAASSRWPTSSPACCS